MDKGGADTAPAFHTGVYLCLLYQGFGLLLPWNVVLNAIPWLQDLYPGEPIATYITSAYIYPQLPVLFLMTAYGHRFSFTSRITLALVAQVVQMAALPLLAPYSMWWTLGIMFTNGIATAVLQSSMFGFSSFFPPVFNQGLMAGQGISGVLACIANVMVQLLLPDANKLAAIVYFAAAAASLTGCLVAYLYVLRVPFAKHYIDRATNHKPSAEPADSYESLEEEEVEQLLRRQQSAAPMESMVSSSGLEGAAAAAGSSSHHHSHPKVTLRTVLPRIWLMALTVWLVFTMTFIMFPGIAPFEFTFQHTLGPLNLSDTWWQLVLLSVFNVFDTIGRTMPAVVQLCRGYTLAACTVARFVIIPLFLGAAKRWASFMNDGFALVVMMAFSFTNGYLASLAMMQGPSLVAPHERQLAGFVMTTALQAGIFLGSQAALALQKLGV